MSAIYYKWISNGGCELCEAMEGVYAERPQRPHPNCKCTILEIDPSSSPGWCLWDEPLIVALTSGHQGHEITYNPETQQYEQIVLQFEATILCRDATVIHLTWRYEDEDPDLPFGPDDDDILSWVEVVADRAEREAWEYAEEECPACREGYDAADDAVS